MNNHNLSGQVPLNVRMRLVFDQHLLQSSVGTASIILTEQKSLTPLRAKYSYAEENGKGVVTILPEYLLDAGKAFVLTLTTKIKNAAGEALAAVQAIDFTTAAALAPTPEGETAQQSWNDAFTPPVPVFHLVSSSPADGAYGINTNPDQGDLKTEIVLTFSEDVDPDQWPEEPESWDDLPVRLTAEAIDGDPRTATAAPAPLTVATSDNTVTITLGEQTGNAYNTKMNPAGTLAKEFEDLTFLPNNLLTLTLSAGLKSAAGTTLGAEQEIVFSSELFPRYGTVRSVFWRQGHITQVLDMSERELDYMIHEESKWLATMMLARDKDARIDLPRQLVLDYVRYKVMWTILNEAVTSQAVTGTTQDKTLGPFRVSKSFSTMPPALLRLLSSWEKGWKQALEALLPMVYFTTAIRGLYSPYRRVNDPNALALRRMGGAQWQPGIPWMRLPDGAGGNGFHPARIVTETL